MSAAGQSGAMSLAGAAQPGRLASLDAFRGFTIAAMLLVNNPGDWGHLYGPLEHAKWNGWTFTDWIFPFFLFICGVSMTLSLGRRSDAGADKTNLLLKLTQRAALIFLIGFCLNFLPYFNLHTVRIFGVLQRIAICTALAAPIVVYLDWRRQCMAIAVLLAIYTFVMLGVPVPDVDGVLHTGLLEPGKDVGAFVDRTLFQGHLWVTSKIWDPEGLVSTLPALCSQLFGVLAGRFLLSQRSGAEKTAWMMVAGLACLWIGSMLDVALMPINKSLWTTSYCIFLTGWALLMFAVFYWLLDGVDDAPLRRRAQWLARPMIMYGMNALFLFALSGFIAKMLGFIKIGPSAVSLRGLLYAPFRTLALTPENASLLYALWFNALMFLIAWLMWRKKWFVKV